MSTDGKWTGAINSLRMLMVEVNSKFASLNIESNGNEMITITIQEEKPNGSSISTHRDNN